MTEVKLTPHKMVSLMMNMVIELYTKEFGEPKTVQLIGKISNLKEEDKK